MITNLIPRFIFKPVLSSSYFSSPLSIYMERKSNQDYIIPAQTRIGHVHLKVSNLERSLKFYCNLLGFSLITTYGTEAAFISAGGYHHHIGLNTWYSKGASPAPVRSAGLFHVAVLYPTRKDLAVAYKRLTEVNYPITGASDH